MISKNVATNILNILTRTGTDYVTCGGYIGLSKTQPSIDSNGNITNVTEPTISDATGYAREQVANMFGGIVWDSTHNYFKSTNTKQIKFNKAITAWTDTSDDSTKIGWFVIYTAATGGTPLFYGSFTTATHVVANQSCNIAVGAAELRFE